MKDKIATIIDDGSSGYLDRWQVDDMANVIYELRYQIAREVLGEWSEFEDSIYALDFVLWLDQQESKE